MRQARRKAAPPQPARLRRAPSSAARPTELDRPTAEPPTRASLVKRASPVTLVKPRSLPRHCRCRHRPPLQMSRTRRRSRPPRRRPPCSGLDPNGLMKGLSVPLMTTGELAMTTLMTVNNAAEEPPSSPAAPPQD